MKNEKRRFRLIKEEEKRRQVTHWDLDYLPKEEILDLYQRGTVYHQQKNSTAHTNNENN
jgi:hypothetical protein